MHTLHLLAVYIKYDSTVGLCFKEVMKELQVA